MHRYKHFTEEAVYRMGQIKSRPQGEADWAKKNRLQICKKEKKKKKCSLDVSVVHIMVVKSGIEKEKNVGYNIEVYSLGSRKGDDDER